MSELTKLLEGQTIKSVWSRYVEDLDGQEVEVVDSITLADGRELRFELVPIDRPPDGIMPVTIVVWTDVRWSVQK
jgi:hypothetical protein